IYMNPSLQDLQKKAYKDLQEAMIVGLEKGELLVEDMQKASRFIIRNMDVVESPEELYLVLKELGQQWRSFQPVFLNFKQKEVVTEDEKKLADVQAKLRQFANLK
ncbi:MAG: hypothetical protein AAB929_01840, partial [Patescibacteria group bacterium]